MMKRSHVIISILALLSIAIFSMSRIYGAPEPIPAEEIESNVSLVDVTNISSRKNILGKWVISGALTSAAKKDTISRLKVRYYFTDGFVELPVDVELAPSSQEPVVFTEKIADHEEGIFDSLQIIEAY